MSTLPLGGMSLAQDNLKKMLAKCATFRTLIDASGDEDIKQTQAENRIHQDAYPTDIKPEGERGTYTLEQLQKLRPNALIWTDGQNGYTRRADAEPGSSGFNESGRLNIELSRDVADTCANYCPEAYVTFSNIIGLIIREMCALSGQGYISLREVGVAEGPYTNDLKKRATEGYVQSVILSVEWGG